MPSIRKWISSKLAGIFLGSFLFLASPQVFANEPIVTIQVLAEEVVSGEEIQIELTISHNANTFLHHVEWINLVINEMQSYHWGYSSFDLPPGETFKRAVSFRVPNVERITIVAEANCLRHGSSGKKTLVVPVKK